MTCTFVLAISNMVVATEESPRVNLLNNKIVMGKKRRREFPEYVTNEFGVKVRKACMSCAYKMCTGNLFFRRCVMHLKNVKPWGDCEDWRMNQTLRDFKIKH